MVWQSVITSIGFGFLLLDLMIDIFSNPENELGEQHGEEFEKKRQNYFNANLIILGFVLSAVYALYNTASIPNNQIGMILSSVNFLVLGVFSFFLPFKKRIILKLQYKSIIIGLIFGILGAFTANILTRAPSVLILGIGFYFSLRVAIRGRNINLNREKTGSVIKQFLEANWKDFDTHKESLPFKPTDDNIGKYFSYIATAIILIFLINASISAANHSQSRKTFVEPPSNSDDINITQISVKGTLNGEISKQEPEFEIIANSLKYTLRKNFSSAPTITPRHCEIIFDQNPKVKVKWSNNSKPHTTKKGVLSLNKNTSNPYGCFKHKKDFYEVTRHSTVEKALKYIDSSDIKY